jgi:hypothetical protein
MVTQTAVQPVTVIFRSDVWGSTKLECEMYCYRDVELGGRTTHMMDRLPPKL